ncbi:hypothetical protein PSTT_03664 [Puccinia striiformis]|uniref:Uncharacterized protein n=1 Tax=Puccinia striiformis TaxID=27350 RepID=A0A2S4VVL1_9BASI|nr:hypothetical protein PSTT_03664 [Puccinia striiformis]
MALCATQLPIRDSSKSDCMTFPLPPTSLQNSASRNGVKDRMSKLPRRSTSISKKSKSIDISLNALHGSIHRGPSKENLTFSRSTNSPFAAPFSRSQTKELVILPKVIPQDPGSDAQSVRSTVPSEHSQDQWSRARVKSNVSRYPITYRLKSSGPHRQIFGAQANSATSLSRAKSYYDQRTSHDEAPALLANASCTELSILTTPTTPGQSPRTPAALHRDPSSHWSNSTGQSQTGILMTPPRSASISCSSPQAGSTGGSSHIAEHLGGAASAESVDDAEFESIQTRQLDLDEQSDCTTFSKKSSVIDRPRPLGRGRGQSFSTSYAEFDKLMTRKSTSTGQSINPGRRKTNILSVSTARPSSIVRNQLASGSFSPQSDCHVHPSLRPSRSFASEGLANRSYTPGGESDVPHSGNSKSDPNKLELCPDIQAQIMKRKDSSIGTNKLQKKHSELKLKNSGRPSKKDKPHNNSPLPTLPNSYPQLSSKITSQADSESSTSKTYFHKLKKIASLRSNREKYHDSRQSQPKTRSNMFTCLTSRSFF